MAPFHTAHEILYHNSLNQTSGRYVVILVASGCGVVFQLSPSGSGWTETVLYTFQGSGSDGWGSGILLQDGAGNLYGAFGCGDCDTAYSVVFMLTPSGGKWLYTELSRQSQYVGDGNGGIGNLAIDPAGNLYGTASFFIAYNCGQSVYSYIFELVPQGSSWQLIYLAPFGYETFSSGGALALDAQGDLYGTSPSCGQYGYGTVWEVSP